MKNRFCRSSCSLLVGLVSAAVATTGLGLVSGCGEARSPSTAIGAGTTSTTTTSGGSDGSGVDTTTTLGGSTNPPVPPPPASSVYVFQSPSTGDASVLQFAASSSGSAAPEYALVLPTPQMLSWNGITADFNGNIYAWGNQITSQPSEILAYSTNNGPTPTVLETIVGSANTFPESNDVTVDAMSDLCVETGSGGNAAILIIPEGGSEPVRTIKGSLTGLDGSGYMAADGSDYLYVSNDSNTPGEIRVFAPTANGNIAPARVIAGSNTLLTTQVFGFDVDAAGDVYAVVWVPATQSTEIVEFAAGASGNVAPIATISGTIAGEQAINVRVDAAGNLYVLCYTPPTINPTARSPLIAVFPAPIASGAAPARQFTSSAWTAPTGNFVVH
jgi:hypothetical protein